MNCIQKYNKSFQVHLFKIKIKNIILFTEKFLSLYIIVDCKSLLILLHVGHVLLI